MDAGQHSYRTGTATESGNIHGVVSIQLYLVILIALAAVGFLAGRWLLILAVLALWVIGLAIAALAGAFHHTSEDSSGGVFYFAAWGTMFWVLAFTLGTVVRRMIRWIASHARRNRARIEASRLLRAGALFDDFSHASELSSKVGMMAAPLAS